MVILNQNYRIFRVGDLFDHRRGKLPVHILIETANPPREIWTRVRDMGKWPKVPRWQIRNSILLLPLWSAILAAKYSEDYPEERATDRPCLQLRYQRSRCRVQSMSHRKAVSTGSKAVTNPLAGTITSRDLPLR